MTVGGDRRFPVFGWLNDCGVEIYEVEEGLSKLKGGKHQVLFSEQPILLRKEGGAWLFDSHDCSIIFFRLGGGQRTSVWYELCRSTMERGKDATAVTPGS